MEIFRVPVLNRSDDLSGDSIMAIQPLSLLGSRAATSLPSLDLSLPPLGVGSQRRRRRRQKPPTRLTPEEESDFLRGTLSAVQFIGETLDKPGAAVRGLLAGQPEQLANLIPFSDMLGITDESGVFADTFNVTKREERVSGRDLLEQFGVLSANQAGLDVGDVAGFVAEVATDPLSFLAIGPLAKGVKLAGAAGKGAKGIKPVSQALLDFKAAVQPGVAGRKLARTPVGVAEQIRAGTRAVAGIKIPFIAEPIATFGAGTKAVPTILEAAFYGGGVLNPLAATRALLSHKVRGSVGQKARTADLLHEMEKGLKDATLDLMPSIRQGEKHAAEEFERIAKHHGVAGEQTAFRDTSLKALEMKGGPTEAKVTELLQSHLLRPNDPVELVDSVDRLSKGMTEIFTGMLDAEREAHKLFMVMGGKSKDLVDTFVDHWGRRPIQSVIEKSRETAEFKGSTQDWFEFQVARRDVVRNYPTGAAGINELVRDRTLWGLSADLKPLTQTHHKDLLRQTLRGAGIDPIPRAGLEKLKKQYLQEFHIRPGLNDAMLSAEEYAEQLTRFTVPTAQVRKIKGRKVHVTEDDSDALLRYFKDVPADTRTEGFYGRKFSEDFHDYMSAVQNKISSLHTTHEFIGRSAQQIGPDSNLTSLKAAWEEAGFHPRGLRQLAKDHFGAETAEQAAEVTTAMGLDAKSVRTLGMLNEVQKKSVQGEFGDMVRRTLATYKSYLFLPFPASHTRNRIGGLWNAWIDGKVGIKDLAVADRAAHKFIRGKGDLGVLDVVDLDDLVGKGQMAEVLGEEQMKGLTRRPSGGLEDVLAAFSPAEFRRKGLAAIDPRGGRGFQAVGAVERPRNVLLEAGERAYAYVEFLNRVGYAEALHRKGFNPSEIIELVKRTQFDYSEMSTFTQKYLRTVFPFPNWPINNIPYQLLKLAERPGGRSAQTIRAFNLAQGPDDETHIPQHLREQLGIPLPEALVDQSPEATTFLAGLGLPTEDVNRTLAFDSKGLRIGRTLEKIAAQAAAPVRYPVEAFSGKQLWSGRALKSLWSPTEAVGKRIPLIDEALHLSPVSRFAGVGRQALDPRKGTTQFLANLLTGVRTTTQDVEKARIFDLQRAMDEELAEDPFIGEGQFYYIPERLKEEAPPEVQERIRKRQSLNRTLSELRALRAGAAG